MKKNIQDLLRDLYEVDPSLKEKENDLKKVIEKLFSSRPDAHIDVQFQSDLKQQLLLRFNRTQKKRQINILNWLRLKAVQRVLGGVVLSTLIVMISLNYYQSKKDQSTFTSYVYVEEKQTEPELKPADKEKLKLEKPKTSLSDNKKAEPVVIEDQDMYSADKDISTTTINESETLVEKKEDKIIVTKKEKAKEEGDLQLDTGLSDNFEAEEDAQDDGVQDLEVKGMTKKSQEPGLVQRLFNNKQKKSLSKKSSQEEMSAEETVARTESIKKTPAPAKIITSTSTTPITGSLDPALHQPLNVPSLSLPLYIGQGSYLSVRQQVLMNRKVKNSSLRTEEMLQHFIYNYPKVRNSSGIQIYTELGQAAWKQDKLLLQVALNTRELKKLNNKAHNVVVMINLQSKQSLNYNKTILKEALFQITKSMRQSDRLSLILLTGSSSRIMEPTRDLFKIAGWADSISHSSIDINETHFQQAYDLSMLNHNPTQPGTIIYLGDSIIPVTSKVESIIKKIRDSKIILKMVSLSENRKLVRNYKDLSVPYTDHSYRVQSVLQIKGLILTAFDFQMEALAKDFQYKIEFNPSVVKDYRIIGYNNTRHSAVKAETMLYSGIQTTLLFEISLHDTDSLELLDTEQIKKNNKDLATIKYRYTPVKTGQVQYKSLNVSSTALPLSSTSPDFKLASAVTMWNMLLQHSPYKAQSTMAQSIDLVSRTLDFDPYGLRRDFIALLKLNRGKTYLKSIDSFQNNLESK